MTQLEQGFAIGLVIAVLSSWGCCFLGYFVGYRTGYKKAADCGTMKEFLK